MSLSANIEFREIELQTRNYELYAIPRSNRSTDCAEIRKTTRCWDNAKNTKLAASVVRISPERLDDRGGGRGIVGCGIFNCSDVRSEREKMKKTFKTELLSASGRRGSRLSDDGDTCRRFVSFSSFSMPIIRKPNTPETRPSAKWCERVYAANQVLGIINQV